MSPQFICQCQPCSSTGANRITGHAVFAHVTGCRPCKTYNSLFRRTVVRLTQAPQSGFRRESNQAPAFLGTKNPERRPGTRELAAEAIRKIVEGDPDWGSFAYEQLTWVLSAAGLFRATRDFALHMFDSPQHDYADSDADEELPNYYAAIGEYDEAIRLWSSEVQKDPERSFFRYERSVLYCRTGQFDHAARDIHTLDDQKFRPMAQAFYHFYFGEKYWLSGCRETLLAQGSVHPSYLVFIHCMLDDLDAAVECYVNAVSSSARSFIDFGPLRAMAKGRLPPELNERLEQHPGFRALLRQHGVTDEWRAELIGQLNAISGLTGIRVEAE